MPTIVESRTLFEIDAELETLFDEIEAWEENGETIPEELLDRFREFCKARGEKVDRIGRFVRMMESRELHCRNEANRLAARARVSASRCGSREIYGSLLPAGPGVDQGGRIRVHVSGAKERPGLRKGGR
jgi:hypothetical protein